MGPTGPAGPVGPVVPEELWEHIPPTQVPPEQQFAVEVQA